MKTNERSMSWGELAQLTHITQVEAFGFCSCEDNEGKENPYSDCPKEETGQLKISPNIKCVECSQTMTREEFAYGHDCETV